jgi:hypothetical protein
LVKLAASADRTSFVDFFPISTAPKSRGADFARSLADRLYSWLVKIRRS